MMTNRLHRGGYINKKGKLVEFICLECETCHKVGAMEGSLKEIPKDKGVHLMFDRKPTVIYFKETEDGKKYEPLCRQCSDNISLVEVEKAQKC